MKNHRTASTLSFHTRFIAMAVAGILAICGRASAQTEPEAPREPEVLKNSFQLSFYSGVSYLDYSNYYDGYYDNCNCDFVGGGGSFNMPYGVSLNIPVFADASLYLRAGITRTSTNFFDGRMDSLKHSSGYGEIGNDLNLRYDVANLDILVRLIGHMDGERVYFGLGLDRVLKKDVLLTETEYDTDTKVLIKHGVLTEGREWRTSFIIGAEYAFVPFKNLYIIPALEIDYGLNKMSTQQPLRPSFYRFLVNVSYQIF
jgi:hypothetical protein